jgi:hypothetical protein
MNIEDSGAELSSEKVGEAKNKGRSQPLGAENENAGTNGIPKEVKVNNTRLSDKS